MFCLEKMADIERRPSNATTQSNGAESHLTNTYQLKPDYVRKFNSKRATDIVRKLLEEHLEGHNYESLVEWRDEQSNNFTDWLASQIQTAIVQSKQFDEKYKYACHVQLVQNCGAACKVKAACFWDGDSDGKAENSYKSDTFVVLASVFAFYHY